MRYINWHLLTFTLYRWNSVHKITTSQLWQVNVTESHILVITETGGAKCAYWVDCWSLALYITKCWSRKVKVARWPKFCTESSMINKKAQQIWRNLHVVLKLYKFCFRRQWGYENSNTHYIMHTLLSYLITKRKIPEHRPTARYLGTAV